MQNTKPGSLAGLPPCKSTVQASVLQVYSALCDPLSNRFLSCPCSCNNLSRMLRCQRANRSPFNISRVLLMPFLSSAGSPALSGVMLSSSSPSMATAFTLASHITFATVPSKTTFPFLAKPYVSLHSRLPCPAGSLRFQSLRVLGRGKRQCHDLHCRQRGKDKVEASHIDLPANVSNGFTATILLDSSLNSGSFKLVFVTPAGKGRLIQLSIDVAGDEPFFPVQGVRRKATVFRIHPELGGAVGVVAPVFGKQPKDMFVWVLEGEVPGLVRAIGPLKEGGPIVSVGPAEAPYPLAAAVKK